jgi:hypothetical protein
MIDLRNNRTHRNRALIVLAAALLLCVIAWIFSPAHFYRAYLFGYFFWLNLSLGAMAIVMLHHLVGGAWGIAVRRLGEAAFMTLPLMAVLFIPIAIGFKHLYPWANEAIWRGDAILEHRRPWFSVGAVLARAVGCFVVWIVLAWMLRRDSIALDSAGDDAEALRLERRMRATSRLGLVLLFITVSLACTDWVMSLEIHWYSTAYGLTIIAAEGLCGCAVMIVALWWFARRDLSLATAAEPDVLHDLGNLLLTTLVLWAYIAFAQFLVIWMGNTQDGNVYYMHRNSAGWKWVTVLIMVFHFAVPFVVLLMQDAKRRLDVLGSIAAGILVMQLIYHLWMIAPSSAGDAPGGVYWIDLLLPPLIGVAWIVVAWRALARAPILAEGLRDALDERQVSHVVSA